MKYFLGIDGGGTKTAFALADETGKIAAASATHGSSYKQYGIDDVVSHIAQTTAVCLEKAAVLPAELAGICMGMPCFGEDREGDAQLSAALREKFAPHPIYVTNDVEVGWAGSLACQPGINVVAGTGSIGFGCDPSGKTARSGGWLEFFGDEGSAYWAGRKTMELFSKQADGRLEKGPLYGLIHREFSLSDSFSFIRIMEQDYIPYREKVASLQIYLERAARAGDDAAKEIYHDAARELAMIVAGVKSQLDFNGTTLAVSCSGGLFKAGDLVMNSFKKHIEDLGGHLQAPHFSPVQGAALLAIRHFGEKYFESAVKTMNI